jgi:hypothetical protein
MDECTNRTINFIQDKIRNGAWKFSTAATYWFSLLDLLDTHSVAVRDFSRYLDTNKITEVVDFPQPLSTTHAHQLFEILKFERLIPELAFATSCWAIASRASDLSQVEARCIVIDSPTTFRVTFTRGKGVTLRGQAYTVAGSNPFLPTIKRTLQATEHPFAAANLDTLRRRMRILDNRYELRSFRRGALQCMAAAGADLEVLRTISGHASQATLLRYLEWGKHAAAQHEPQREIATPLWLSQ